MSDIAAWMDSVSDRGWLWFIKRLSSNDTYLTGANQAGQAVPNRHAFQIFPSLWERRTDRNPRVSFDARIDSHQSTASPEFIYYNNKTWSPTGTRNECRMTNWGGSKSPILDEEATGAICIFAFFKEHPESEAEGCRVWLCRNPLEEELLEDRVAPIEPGHPVLFDAGGLFPDLFAEPEVKSCWLSPDAMPKEWKFSFPEAEQIVAYAAKLKPGAKKTPDARLIARRDCEYDIFRSVEEYHVLPRIREGFASVDLFFAFAHSVSNRRKSRAGRSLELHASTIFDEEGLVYTRGGKSEGNKRPDFLFPCVEAYHNGGFPTEKLRMLAAKTTCKDRWRQVINEANRIGTKHLLTLQHGITVSQFNEMKDENVVLVVPEGLRDAYPKEIRHELVILRQFINETKAICA